ncbi:hypothetical protein ACIA8K_12570 [Catenuloplanes sp. NPDC051500]|uniref:hypothetical protein n=1 Tax=Catenuloplanes sp. NPDC051500 TaxID=3363959 RepID=UPI00379056C1
MTATKVQNQAEAIAWIEEGRPYRWIIDKYIEKYGIETKPAMWSNFRRKHGIKTRTVRNESLVPWKIEEHHRTAYHLEMLRAEARRRAGVELLPEAADKLRRFHENLEETGTVVHYSPKKGFTYAPRRPGVDLDLIREPASRNRTGSSAGE